MDIDACGSHGKILDLNIARTSPRKTPAARFGMVLTGVSLFLAYQFGLALWNLSHSSGEMENKFSALARDKYLGFLVLQNLRMLVAYAALAIAAAFIVQPIVSIWTARSKWTSRRWVILRSLVMTALVHGYFTLRLVETRPYFLNPDNFGNWYYRTLEIIPASIKPQALFVLFTIVPLVLFAIILCWHLRRWGRPAWIAATAAVFIGASVFTFSKHDHPQAAQTNMAGKSMNVIIIGSDSLRGDRLGCAGYKPARQDDRAAAGVSPAIDALAKRSVQFENCYTSIASTMESGVQLMSSRYPQSHGIRQMYPDRQTVAATNARIVTLPALLNAKGYDTTALGDWCAGYYEVLPMGFKHLSVSSFDNFKIYMSQAVVMAHFVIPLYFDNPLGHQVFPQLEAFAEFVTPDVVTQRVQSRLADVAKTRQPFFWHVFYSCNHLPYRCREPYRSLFTDPAYEGPNRNGVAFDIDKFIGGTGLDEKWKALSPKEIVQIRALYDGCTRQFDDCVANILSSIRENGLEDNTIVIITADHGDDHYEPGVTLGHGLTFNGGLQANHVPMIVHVPGQPAAVIPECVRLIDVIPTLAELVREPASPTWEGKSFAKWIDRSEAPVWRPFYGETGFPFVQFPVPGVERPKLPPMDQQTIVDPSFNFQFVLKPEFLDRLIAAKQRCLRTRHWKLVCTPTVQGTRHFSLFQLSNDRYGETDLAASRPEVLAAMRPALEHWMDDNKERSIAEIFPAGEPE